MVGEDDIPFFKKKKKKRKEKQRIPSKKIKKKISFRLLQPQ